MQLLLLELLLNRLRICYGDFYQVIKNPYSPFSNRGKVVNPHTKILMIDHGWGPLVGLIVIHASIISAAALGERIFCFSVRIYFTRICIPIRPIHSIPARFAGIAIIPSHYRKYRIPNGRPANFESSYPHCYVFDGSITRNAEPKSL